MLLPYDINLPPLWDHQIESIERLRDGIRREVKGQVLAAPTGSGKTMIAAHMIASALNKGKEAVFTVDRIALLEQTSRAFYEAGIPHGLIGGGVVRGLTEPIKVAMVQTLARRGWPPADVVFVDECHYQFKFLRETLPELKCPYIGLTATPMTKGMGNTYQELVEVTTTNRLIKDGILTPVIVKAAVPIDMSGAKLVNGEWSASDVQDRGRVIIGDIVATWQEETHRHFGGPVKTMVFASSIAHGQELCEQFQSAGYDFRQVTAYDDPKHVEDTLAEYRHGGFPGIVSVDKLSKGVDIPDVLCLVVARPYRKAFAAHIQMWGRVMRKAAGKTVGLILDHTENCLFFYDQTQHLFEHGVGRLDDSRFTNAKRQDKPPRDLACKGCGHLMSPGQKVCPICGKEKKRRNMITTEPGTVVEVAAVDGSGRASTWQGTSDALWEACCAVADKSLRWHHDMDRALRHAKAQFKDLTGKWPPRHYRWSPGKVPAAVRRELDRRKDEWKAKNKQAGVI